MKALIDGDLLPYECGGLTKTEVPEGETDYFPDIAVGDALPFEVCWKIVQNKVDHILKTVNADSYTIYLSSQEVPTWRFERATILPYKGGRKSDKPVYWKLIRDNLQLHYNTKVVEFIEADDAMSIAQYEDLKAAHKRATADGGNDDGEYLLDYVDTVICSRDKDLGMVPGWHFSWGVGGSPDKMFYQSKTAGLRCFYQQLCTGDKQVDNILGLHGVGAKSAMVQRIRKYETEGEMFREVYKAYKERFGNYAKQFLVETGQLLWMQQNLDDRWNPFEDGRADQWAEEVRVNESA